jgi:DNA polymerase-3 subunit delta'
MVGQEEQENNRPCRRCGQCKKVFSGIHPDVKLVTGPAEGKPITVDQIRDLRADAYIRPNEGRRKVYILENAGDMRAEAQNAMLKLLEEGPEYAAFMLLSENSGAVLETIRSRCEQFPLAPVSLGESEAFLREHFPEKSPEEIRTAALNAQGILGRAVEELAGGSEETARLRRQVAELADILCNGDELAVLEGVNPLEKLSKDEWNALLSAMEVELVSRMGKGAGDRKRMLRCVELCRQLREATFFNTNPGQLAGWLCAGIFSD